MPTVHLQKVICALFVASSFALQGCTTLLHSSGTSTAMTVMADEYVANCCSVYQCNPVVTANLAVKHPRTLHFIPPDPFLNETPVVLEEPEWSHAEAVPVGLL